MNEMKKIEEELLEGARRLECTTYGVVNHKYLKPYMAPQHWDSLIRGLVRGVPFFWVKQSQCMLTIPPANEPEGLPAYIFLASFGYQKKKGSEQQAVPNDSRQAGLTAEILSDL